MIVVKEKKKWSRPAEPSWSTPPSITWWSCSIFGHGNGSIRVGGGPSGQGPMTYTALYAFAGNAPCLSKASIAKEACAALNHFLRDRFPDGKWTSLAVILNPRTQLQWAT